MPLSVVTTTWPLLLGMGVLMLGAGLQSTLLGLRATLEGFPTVVTGVVMSCYYVGYVLGTIIAPPLLRQLGHIRVFAALAAVASVAILVQGGFVDAWTWGSMRLVSGVCFAGIYVVAESWLNDRATRATRGRLFAVYMVILYVGLGAAQFLLVLSDPRTPASFMLVSVLISLAMVPIVVSAQHVPDHAVPRKVHLRDLYRNSPLGVVAVTIADAADASRFAALEATGQVRRFSGWLEWSTQRFEVSAGGAVEVGVDGEALTMDPPVVFESRPGALRVRLPRRKVGASPAARAVNLLSGSTVAELWQVAAAPGSLA